MSDNVDPVWYFAVPSPLDEGGWLVFVRHDATKLWWRLVARFEDEVRARDYAECENEILGEGRRTDFGEGGDPILYEGERPAPVEHLPAAPVSAIVKENFRGSLGAAELADLPVELIGQLSSAAQALAAEWRPGNTWRPEEVELLTKRKAEKPGELLKLFPYKTLNSVKSKLRQVRGTVKSKARKGAASQDKAASSSADDVVAESDSSSEQAGMGFGAQPQLVETTEDPKPEVPTARRRHLGIKFPRKWAAPAGPRLTREEELAEIDRFAAERGIQWIKGAVPGEFSPMVGGDRGPKVMG
jgi:hypothetical protein